MNDNKTAYSGKDYPVHSSGPWSVTAGIAPDPKGRLIVYELKVPDEEMDLEQHIVMCHYPIESWNKRHHGSWHLHGHCHGSLPSPDWQARLDVGVDVHKFKPIPYEEVKALMTFKVFKPIDHHRESIRK